MVESKKCKFCDRGIAWRALAWRAVRDMSRKQLQDIIDKRKVLNGRN